MLATGCADKQVGIVWNYFWFEPKRSSWWTPFYLPWIRRGGRGALGMHSGRAERATARKQQRTELLGAV